MSDLMNHFGPECPCPPVPPCPPFYPPFHPKKDTKYLIKRVLYSDVEPVGTPGLLWIHKDPVSRCTVYLLWEDGLWYNLLGMLGSRDESNISWNQIITSGTKIATITIGDETTDVYAPTGGGSTVEFDPEYTDGIKIATLTINGEEFDVYIPSSLVTEAPTDGRKYARQNGEWVVVEGGSPSPTENISITLNGQDVGNQIVTLNYPDSVTLIASIAGGTTALQFQVYEGQTTSGGQIFESDYCEWSYNTTTKQFVMTNTNTYSENNHDTVKYFLVKFTTIGGTTKNVVFAIKREVVPILTITPNLSLNYNAEGIVRVNINTQGTDDDVYRYNATLAEENPSYSLSSVCTITTENNTDDIKIYNKNTQGKTVYVKLHVWIDGYSEYVDASKEALITLYPSSALPPAPTNSISSPTKSLNFNSEGNLISDTSIAVVPIQGITSGNAVEVISSGSQAYPDWITVGEVSVVGTGWASSISVDNEYTGTENRVGTVYFRVVEDPTVTCNIVVTQHAASITPLSASPSSLSFDAAGGTLTSQITSGSGIYVNTENSVVPSGITYTLNQSTKVLTVVATENPSTEDKTGSIVIRTSTEDITINLSQSGAAAPDPYITLLKGQELPKDSSGRYLTSAEWVRASTVYTIDVNVHNSSSGWEIKSTDSNISSNVSGIPSLNEINITPEAYLGNDKTGNVIIGLVGTNDYNVVLRVTIYKDNWNPSDILYDDASKIYPSSEWTFRNYDFSTNHFYNCYIAGGLYHKIRAVLTCTGFSDVWCVFRHNGTASYDMETSGNVQTLEMTGLDNYAGAQMHVGELLQNTSTSDRTATLEFFDIEKTGSPIKIGPTYYITQTGILDTSTGYFLSVQPLLYLPNSGVGTFITAIAGVSRSGMSSNGWTAEVDSSDTWLHITPSSHPAADPTEIETSGATVSADVNDTGSEREGTITFSTDASSGGLSTTLTVIQRAS